MITVRIERCEEKLPSKLHAEFGEDGELIKFHVYDNGRLILTSRCPTSKGTFDDKRTELLKLMVEADLAYEEMTK